MQREIYRNALFKIVDLIGGYLNEDEDVKSLFSLGADEIDQQKNDVFPLANIQLQSVDFQNSQITFEITHLNIRDENKNGVEDKFAWNDNRWENWSVSYSVLLNLLAKLKLIRVDGIEFVSSSDPTIINKDFQTGLDGLVLSVTFWVNTSVKICEC